MVGICLMVLLAEGKQSMWEKPPQCKGPQCVHILIYDEQCASDPNVYGKMLAYKKKN